MEYHGWRQQKCNQTKWFIWADAKHTKDNNFRWKSAITNEIGLMSNSGVTERVVVVNQAPMDCFISPVEIVVVSRYWKYLSRIFGILHLLRLQVLYWTSHSNSGLLPFNLKQFRQWSTCDWCFNFVLDWWIFNNRFVIHNSINWILFRSYHT